MGGRRWKFKRGKADGDYGSHTSQEKVSGIMAPHEFPNPVVIGTADWGEGSHAMMVDRAVGSAGPIPLSR